MEGGKKLLKTLAVKGGFFLNVGCLIHCATEYLAEFTLCIGPSMKPTLNRSSNGDIVITEHVSARYRQLKRNDIVIARCPSNPDKMICKRIAAMAGDIIEKPEDDSGYIKVPKGHVWLLGDNSNNSTDSRLYGPVPYGLLKGRVCFRVWPPKEFGRI